MPIDIIYEDIVMVLRDFRNMEDEVCKWLLTGVMFPVTFLLTSD